MSPQDIAETRAVIALLEAELAAQKTEPVTTFKVHATAKPKPAVKPTTTKPKPTTAAKLATTKPPLDAAQIYADRANRKTQ